MNIINKIKKAKDIMERNDTEAKLENIKKANKIHDLVRAIERFEFTINELKQNRSNNRILSWDTETNMASFSFHEFIEFSGFQEEIACFEENFLELCENHLNNLHNALDVELGSTFGIVRNKSILEQYNEECYK